MRGLAGAGSAVAVWRGGQGAGARTLGILARGLSESARPKSPLWNLWKNVSREKA